MSVSVVTLWLIYLLVFLVVALILALPNMYVPQRGLVIALFAAIVAALVITFIPVQTNGGDVMTIWSYNGLLAISYVLPVILIIILAVSYGDHGHVKRIDMTCDRDGSNCTIDKAIVKNDGHSKIKVTYR